MRDSGAAGRVAAYRRERTDPRDCELAVLVQRLVDADAAGVALSANPVTGADEVVIEAVRGLGDRLLSGDLAGDRWVVVENAPRPITETGVIDVSVGQRIAALARRVALERDAPQDLEWALGGDELSLLQARRVTGLPQEPEIQIPPGRWVKDTTHWSGPMTPAGASILLPVIESAFARALPEFGLPLEAIRFRSFGGEVYTQEVDPGGAHNPDLPPPWWVLAVASRLVPSMRRMARAAEAALTNLGPAPAPGRSRGATDVPVAWTKPAPSTSPGSPTGSSSTTSGT